MLPSLQIKLVPSLLVIILLVSFLLATFDFFLSNLTSLKMTPKMSEHLFVPVMLLESTVLTSRF